MKNRKKLRRVAIMALVLVLLLNAMGVNASTGAPTVTVSSYGELYTTYVDAKNGDVIGIRGTIVIPTLVSFNSKAITFKRMEAGARILFSDVYNSEAVCTVGNVTFDGNATEVGGTDVFVSVSGNVDFMYCDFIDCLYEGGNGGAVYVGYGEVNFIDCKFKSNSAYNGSHVYNNGILTVENSTFSDGWTDEMGGAIFNAGTLYIKDTEIKENNARTGGGIYNSSSMEITNSLVWKNTVTRQGADIANEGSLTNYTTDEQYNELLSQYGLYYAGWEDDTNTSIGGAGEYLKFLTTTEEPTEPEPTTPVDPTEPTDPEEPTTPTEPTQPVEPTDPEPTEPVEPTQPTDPQEPTEPTDPTDPEPETPTKPSTPSTEDKDDPIATPSNPTDNSTTNNSQSSSSNSSSSVSNVDNSSSVSNSDTDNSRSESSKTENSNNSSTVNNYYQQEQGKQDTTTASQNFSQPVNVTVPVSVSVPKEKGENEENEANTEAGSTTAPTSSLADKNIKIDAKGVDVVLEITGDTYNISISAPEDTRAEQVQTIATATPTVSQEPPEEESKPNWVESMCMVLLAVLVGLEVKDRLRKKPE